MPRAPASPPTTAPPPACARRDTAAASAAPTATQPPPAEPPPVDPLQVERGQYLAAAGNCVSCHTRPGGEPFAGGLPIHTPFGTIYSTNITPNPETGIGGWGEADLIRAMHEGVAADGHKLIPAFPYIAFTKVTDEDVKAIYAYLKTLTPVNYRPPSNGIMFSMRWPMAFWNALFFKPERFKPDTAQSEEWNRGAYLVEGLGHCSACHSPRNAFMAEIDAQAYSGGAHPRQGRPTARSARWSAVNLTPAKTGLGAWSADDIAKYLKTGFSVKHAGAWGPMTEVIVNSMRKLTDEDTHAMAVYLKSLPPREPPGGVSITEDQAKAGAPIYKDKCSKCHMDSGRGGLFNGPPLEASAVVQSADAASMINIILYGPRAPKEVSTGQWETMKPFNDSMSDADVAAVANYVRSSWGNSGRPVTAADVARQERNDRGEPPARAWLSERLAAARETHRRPDPAVSR